MTMREMIGEKRIQKGLWWTRNWNLVEGCTKISSACQNCFAEKYVMRFRKTKPEYTFLVDAEGWTGIVKLNDDSLDIFTPRMNPAVWFVTERGDLFHELVPDVFITKVFDIMRRWPQHIFLVLTKRPERMLKFVNFNQAQHIGDFPDNIWLGITAENQAMFEYRWASLSKCPTKNLFISAEPLLSMLRLGESKPAWVICGCESGANRRHTERRWIELLRDDCSVAGIPFFQKQIETRGRLVKAPYFDGRQWLELPR